MGDPLKSKTINALSWSLVESVGVRGAQFVIGIVLARILYPEQFGLMAMLTIFIAVAQTFFESGFGAALIQKKDISQTDICSIFYFNILVGLAAAGLLCWVAPWIAAFYDQPILTSLTRALSLTIVISSFGLIQAIKLTREINFKAQAKVGLLANILSGMLGVALAIGGFGVWSLVAQQVFSSLVRTTCLWLFSAWRPELIFSFKSLREMFGFGSRMLLSGLLNQIFDNIYLLVIGKLFSATNLGYFSRAKTLQEIPTHTLSGMIANVTFPVFSAIQDDPVRMKRGLRKALTLLALVNFPIMIGLAVVAHPLVLVLLTEKWAECVPYVQLFCVLGMLYPVHVINLNILVALGRSDLFLRLEIVKKVLIIINIVVTWRWGMTAMIYGMIVTSCISYYLNSYYTGIFISYPIREQLRDVFSYLAVAVLMGMAVYSVGLLPFATYWFMLLTQIFIGAVIYLFICRIIRLSAFMEIWQTGWNKIALLKARTAG